MRIAFKRPATAIALCCFAASGILLTVSTPAASQPDGPAPDPPSPTSTSTPTPTPTEGPSESPTPTETPTDKPTQEPTQKPSEKPKPEKPKPEKPDDPEDSSSDQRRLPRTGPEGSSPVPPDGRYSSGARRGSGYPDTGNGGTNWVPHSPGTGSGGYSENNRGAQNDPVPTPEAEQDEASGEGPRNSALKGNQARSADNAEARSSSLLWGGLTILLGLAVIAAAWLFLRKSQKDDKQRG